MLHGLPRDTHEPNVHYALDYNHFDVNHHELDYLMAFGPSRHRAWVVSERPRGRLSGSLRRALESMQGTVLRPLGSLLGASWGFLGASWPLGGLLGASWGLLGAS